MGGCQLLELIGDASCDRWVWDGGEALVPDDDVDCGGIDLVDAQGYFAAERFERVVEQACDVVMAKGGVDAFGLNVNDVKGQSRDP